ncbi:putative cellobiohydrolase [Aspergillus clavatus NRRL 1]|uniref:Probable 1,4-beta-D-glucan cellobiohydrolase C n=1 Tax=Aspergillus clavatus (strain ATCC 1007 / CBS 513.65 / DSM 816 / NCTC 3887 / NRRL 1 / QM 1276 / 107) TaxID=344612 RepID=CBHC_ASPCL|nr:cellobiohydrolase, putative [Aspergillus clavatus NRRL 1]A1CCN4.1 RecName: Full=Probable 1,4-beta-D-glucan cellobiohydrolase C; AltName: Full=Beta-glucancellobiohydrolase C; AltName: Full=Exocellobiohydrolase C; AltName: Full=Exoglucanase C; Flags: Precursor [Aspergillus clavatus NRRL 1]EAW12291.1 cellobiohydrolase, putative [Aspergillus clavatus NRRL 1]
MKNFAPSLALSLLLPTVQAQQTMWGQCGGAGWSGATDCVAGGVCSTQNAYYAQCLPGATTATTLSTTSKGTTTTTTSSTTSTGGGSSSTTTKTSTSAGPTVTGSPSGNPFSGYQQYANPYYSSEVHTLAIPSMTGALAVKASAVADVPSFVWLDVAAKVPTMGTYLENIRAKNKAGANPPVAGIFVVYDLPDRDCAALASNGEYAIADGGIAKYKAYIDAIRAQLLKYPDVHTILVIEPDSLANLITNINVAKCSGAKDAYLECINYALKQLNLPNVAMYIDAGHGGWLGWDANIGPAAEMYAKVYKDADAPAALRGLAVNVANYNAWTIDTCPSYTQGNKNCDEKRYIHALYPLLKAAGWDARFIMDTGRNGVQPTKQQAQGDWCNVIGTGFGIRPSSETGDDLLDAFVWVKPGAESDGTSDTTAARYDAHCGYTDALKPAPEAGQWFQAYFEQLLTNANPAF